MKPLFTAPISEYDPTDYQIVTPPNMAAAIGYFGPARYLGLYWEGDDVMMADGAISTSGTNYRSLAAFKHHRLYSPLFYQMADQDIDFGTHETQATHWLILDRQEHKMLVLTAASAKAFLGTQHEGTLPEDPDAELGRIVVGSEEWHSGLREAQQRIAVATTVPELAPGDILARLQYDTQQTAILTRWLDSAYQQMMANIEKRDG